MNNHIFSRRAFCLGGDASGAGALAAMWQAVVGQAWAAGLIDGGV